VDFGKAACPEHKHSSGLDFLTATGCNIGFKVFGPYFLELERDTTPHNHYTIYGVHKGFGIYFKDIPFFVYG